MEWPSTHRLLRHLNQAVGCDLIVDEFAHLYGALGSALGLLSQREASDSTHARNSPLPFDRADHIDSLLVADERPKQYAYPPLSLHLSDYPTFDSQKSYDFSPRCSQAGHPVEVDIYQQMEPDQSHSVHLGIDIGSTSTKAILIGEKQDPIAGFYTRTAGHPIQATQAIFEAIHTWCLESDFQLHMLSVGTTGSGRKFIGRIIGADIIVDEITAHARAATALDPGVDTIIEIGGQDAKFTTLKNGRVTFSQMNNVCAAGTGSFIEEQAQKLKCSLKEYSHITQDSRAPLASDRCTVFMEREINHHISAGYSIPEILTAVLHSVRENYLSKVARPAMIGENICFQGATAKNRSLVAAFEYKLGKPIRVSKYCHLTGALGVAMLLAEQPISSSKFFGLDLFQEQIPITGEICDVCTNHCKIKVAQVKGQTVAYGFMCGRDYDVSRYVSNNSSGFALLQSRRRLFRSPPPKEKKYPITIGIPATLYMLEELPLWERFFDNLGVNFITSHDYRQGVATGKKRAGAEFCAPIAGFHGHVAHLGERCDYIFAPVYLHSRTQPKNSLRRYCYYTQFASTLAATMQIQGLSEKLLMPLINHGIGSFNTKAHLYTSLNPILNKSLSLRKVSACFDEALDFFNSKKAALKDMFAHQMKTTHDICVCLLGRPYTILSPELNNGIPDMFASLGIKTFFQDMLPYTNEDVDEIAELLKTVHWEYAAKILEATQVIAKTPGLYPVLITSFMCAPDSCIVEYVKRILDTYQKPYLILQLDEHDSRVGYETRVEAGIRAFRNHLRSPENSPATFHSLPVIPRVIKSLGDKTLLLPNWDPICGPLLAKNLEHEGFDVRLLPEDESSIQRSLSLNNGQCIPLTAMTQNCIDYIQSHDLDPQNTALWMIAGNMACNIRLLPYNAKSILEAYGQGLRKSSVYRGEAIFTDFSMRIALNSHFAYMFGGILRKLACRIRPYERIVGQTDSALKQGQAIFEDVFTGKLDKLTAVNLVVDLFKAIDTYHGYRPKVAFFGDAYVRDNDIMNQQLIHTIERHGGEVVTTPYSEYAKIVSTVYLKKWLREGKYLDVLTARTLLTIANILDKPYLNKFSEILEASKTTAISQNSQELFERYHLTPHHTGETVDNILKLTHLLNEYPDIALFVQLSPAYCCPSIVSQGMAYHTEKVTGVPVITITYDGTISSKNDQIVPYLQSLCQAAEEKRSVKSSRIV